jgi:hypothetical protein
MQLPDGVAPHSLPIRLWRSQGGEGATQSCMPMAQGTRLSSTCFTRVHTSNPHESLTSRHERVQHWIPCLCLLPSALILDRD